ncbi:hypothetical protein J1N35_035318, partial [Gossypium stocksii]
MATFVRAMSLENKQKFCEVKAFSFLLVGGSGSVDSIGVLDGTHVRASVPLSIQGSFRSRKRGTTQNVLAAITFDLKFSYVLTSWECSAHDSRILNDALSRPRGLRIREEYSAQGPENAKELFNLRHSSLRTTNERVFRILKKWFRVLDAEPFWNFQTQVDIVLACCIIHNYIMGVDPSDLLNQGLYKELEFDLIIPTLTKRKEREEVRGWSAKREEIAQTMWSNYMARNIRFQVQCDVKHVKNHLRTVKNQWQIICTIQAESGFGWDDNMKMITYDRATYDAAVMNKSIDHYDEMTLVVGKDMAIESFTRTFADIDLDYGNQDLVPIDCDNKEIEEVRTKVSSSGTSKRKRKNAQESVVDEQIKFVGEQLGKIANALEQFTTDKTPHLYEEVMPIEVEGFADDFLVVYLII